MEQMIENDFSYLDNKDLEKLILLFNTYNYFDLCRSVYCINSYLPNRSHLDMSFSLNLALIRCNKNGEKHITIYDDFINFAEDILKIIGPSDCEDSLVTDNGEFRVLFNKKFYRVVLGNGYNQSFSLYQSIEPVINKIGKASEMESTFQFVDEEIIEITPYNLLPNDFDYLQFYTPTREYFEQILKQYIDKTIPSILKFFSSNTQTNISKTHFICLEDKYLRLYNTSLVIDVFHYLIKKSDIIHLASYAFADAFIKNFTYIKESNIALVNAAIVDDFSKHTIIENIVFDAALFNEKTLILFANLDKFQKINIITLKEAIQNKITLKELHIAELAGNKTRVAKLENIGNFILLPFISDLSIEGSLYTAPKNIDFIYHVYDLIHLFYKCTDINDIIDFITLDYTNEFEPLSLNLSGNVSKFNFWIANNKLVNKGAINYNLISTGIYDDELYLLDEYKKYNLWFPFDNPTFLMMNPLIWKNHTDSLGFYEISDKSTNHSFGGQIRKINGLCLFLSENIDLYTDKSQQQLVFLQTIQELNARYFVLSENVLIKSGFYSLYNIEVLHLPLDYAKKVDGTGFTRTNNKYVYSDAMVFDSSLQIRYAIDFPKLNEDLEHSKDNEVEIIYFSELLSCLKKVPFVNYSVIEEWLSNNVRRKKQVVLKGKKLDFYVSDYTHDTLIDDYIYAKVEKIIALCCQEAGLEVGEYDKRDFRLKVRILQNNIIPKFEKMLSQYDKIELHKLLLSVLSNGYFQKIINDDRVDLKENEALCDEAKIACEENIVRTNSKYKALIRFVAYAIDTNLSINHENNQTPDLNVVKQVIAFADRLINIQDSSDDANYNLLPLKLRVDHDYLVVVQYAQEVTRILSNKTKRQMNCTAYLPSLDFKDEFFDKSLECFYEDSGIKLPAILDVCNYLKFEFTFTFKKESLPNVFVVNYHSLLEDMLSVFPSANKEELANALNYLIINENEIKKIDGKENDFVPIWEREKRTHRIETRPIVKQDDSLIFSPIIINNLFNLWFRGIFDFYLPYEFGLDSLMMTLTKWKHSCEKQMEEDVKNLFPDGCAEKNVELYKRDKEFGHPLDLGDYDVLAIDVKHKTIYNLETKYLIKTGSIREYYNQQDSFFIKDKRGDHFQNRINYIEKNRERILRVIFNIEDGEQYNIKSYMVTNKVFTCDICDIDFEIITFSELKKIVDENLY